MPATMADSFGELSVAGFRGLARQRHFHLGGERSFQLGGGCVQVADQIGRDLPLVKLIDEPSESVQGQSASLLDNIVRYVRALRRGRAPGRVHRRTIGLDRWLWRWL